MPQTSLEVKRYIAKTNRNSVLTWYWRGPPRSRLSRCRYSPQPGLVLRGAGLPPTAPDNRVVPEHGSAGRAFRPDRIRPNIASRYLGGLGDSEPDVVVLVVRVVVVAVRRLQVVVVVVERTTAQAAISAALSSRLPVRLRHGP